MTLFLFSSLILVNFNRIFNHYNSLLFIIQPKWMCKRNITCTNNASSSSSSLSQIMITIPYPPLLSSLLSYCNDRPHFIQVFTMMQPYGPLLCFISLHISNGSVSTSLVGYVLYSVDLMSATCIPHSLLMVHRYIYSRYSPVFLMLYQLYYSLPSSTLNSSSSLYLSVAT